MLSRSIVTVARGRALLAAGNIDAAVLSKGWKVANSYSRRANFHSTHLLQAETVKVPQMAESISEGTLKSWLKQPGDSVEADEEVATIETDKIDVSVNAPSAGTITEHLANEEDTVTVGQDLFRFEPGEGGSSKPVQKEGDEPMGKETKDPEEPKDQQLEKGASPPPKPAADDIQSKDPGTVAGGEAKKELKESASKPAPAPSKGKGKTESAPPPARVAGSRNENRVKMSRMRLRIAERLKESQNAAAALTTFNEIDMSSLMELRKANQREFFALRVYHG